MTSKYSYNEKKKRNIFVALQKFDKKHKTNE